MGSTPDPPAAASRDPGSGLPLTGSLAGSLGPGAGMSAGTLAAVGQMGNIRSGGGPLVAWSSLIAVAGFARVPVVEQARKCVLPVVAGLVMATVFAVVVFGVDAAYPLADPPHPDPPPRHDDVGTGGSAAHAMLFDRNGLPVDLADTALVALAGFGAGTINAAAGGGTLISFPALLATGIPAITANITSSVGLVTGYVGSAVGYRRELRGQRERARAMIVPAVAGGIAGAVILLVTPETAFRAIVPFLVLLACLLLAVQPWVASIVASRRGPAYEGQSEVTPLLYVGLFCSAVYGSYFGAGLGVLLLAVLGILLDDDLQRLNGLKSVLSFVVNVVGVLIFVASGQVAWAFATVLLVTSYLGGMVGASIARLLRPVVLRYSVVVLGAVVGVALLVTG